MLVETMQSKQTALVLAMTLGFIASSASPSKGQQQDPLETIRKLDGNASLYHPKTKQNLGIISSNRYDSDSICNPHGNYGSKHSNLSIFNPYADYGSKYSDLSAYNPNTQYPPVILLANGNFVLLTKNSRVVGVDPDILRAVICTER